MSTSFAETFFNPEIIARYLPDILWGMVVTAETAVAVVITGIALGLVLALLRAYNIRALNALVVVLVDLFRALPPLVIILVVFFALPGFGLYVPSFGVLWLVLSLVLAAFAEEIFWAGILSVRRGQWEAARSTGLTHTQTLIHVVLPQAVRLGAGPLTNRVMAITKSTSLGTVIGVPEILNQAMSAQSFSGSATPLTMGLIAYMILFIPVVVAGRAIEGRLTTRRIRWN
jgi:polar amino acid transport system permease protein